MELAASDRPDAAVVDVMLGDDDGLALCLKLKSLTDPPAVVLYTAITDAAMSVKARLVGADGLVTKGSPVAELTRALENALAGESFVPRPDPEALSRLDGRVTDQDLAVLGLRLELTPADEIAEVLTLRPEQVTERILRLVAALGGAARTNGGNLSAR